LGGREVVLEREHTTDHFGKVTEEGVGQRRHTPMQPDALLAGNTRQQSYSPIPKDDVLRLNSTPDSQYDAGCLRPGFLARKLISKALIHKRTQFLLVRPLNEPVKHVIEPSPFQRTAEASSLSISFLCRSINSTSKAETDARPPFVRALSKATRFRSSQRSAGRWNPVVLRWRSDAEVRSLRLVVALCICFSLRLWRLVIDGSQAENANVIGGLREAGNRSRNPPSQTEPNLDDPWELVSPT
jgi:hypothetical protein